MGESLFLNHLRSLNHKETVTSQMIKNQSSKSKVSDTNMLEDIPENEKQTTETPTNISEDILSSLPSSQSNIQESDQGDQKVISILCIC